MNNFYIKYFKYSNLKYYVKYVIIIISFCKKGGITMDKENKIRTMMRMDQLKDETMHEIRMCIEKHSENRKKSTKNEITASVINRFKAIMEQRGIRIDPQYLEGELSVLVSALEKRGKISDDYLQSNVNRLLNRHIEYAIEEVETDEKKTNLKRNESKSEDVLDKSKTDRRKAINNNQIPKIEEYLHDIFSHTMRSLEYRGINISERDKDELRHEVLSRLKYNVSNDMGEFFENDNNQLSQEIMRKISEFFSEMDKVVEQQEKQSSERKEKKPWELSASEMRRINPAEALKKSENNRSYVQNELPDHIID